MELKDAQELDPAQGAIDFGEGARVDLAADAAGLRLTVQAADAAALPRLEEVVAEHLNRFAFREELAFVWQPA